METSRKWTSFSLPSGEVNATGSFWGMASHCLPMPNPILSNLIEFYGPHSNLRTHSKFPFLSCIQIEHTWEARSISILTKSNVQMHCIYCYFSSAPPASIPACYSRPTDFENSVSIQLTSRDFQRTGHESKSWLFFLQGMLGMKLTISFQGAQGPKPKAQHPQVVERKKPGMPCPFDLTQVSLSHLSADV